MGECVGALCLHVVDRVLMDMVMSCTGDDGQEDAGGGQHAMSNFRPDDEGPGAGL